MFVHWNIDPDQSIFGFRNAAPKNFLKMQEDYSDVGVINMEQNYRSSGTILKAALHVIKQGKSKILQSLDVVTQVVFFVFRCKSFQ